MTREEKLSHCSGCYCNDYNHGLGGAKECWHLDTMKLAPRKEVHVDQRPPWNQRATLLPTCYHRQRYVYVAADQTC